jgi:flagella basal body P-ring formation protein FlgA
MKIRTTLLARLTLAALLLWSAPLRAEDSTAIDALRAQAEALTLDSARPPDGLRVEVEVGRLDPRLKLAPCARIDTYLPSGFKPWGRTRVGLRCVEGAVRWNVFLPVTVKVHGPALVAASALQAGSVLTADDLSEAEIDLAADPAAALTDPALLVGRVLARTVSAGQALRQHHVRPRQWFAAGETVKVVAVGAGFAVQTEGQAVSAGLEGSPVRVRTDSGRIVTGQAVGERRVEVAL